MFNTGASDREVKEKQFELAIRQFDQFNKLYEKLKGQRLRDKAVIMSEFGRLGVPDASRQESADIFTDNIRYIGLVKQVSGNEYVRSVEQVSQEVPAVPEFKSPEPHTAEPTESAKEPVEGNGVPALATNRPALHIDIQVHIDPTSSAELIDQIFASMAKHLYGNES